MSTRPQLLAAVQADFPTNNAREITAEVLRDFLDDYIDSVWIPSTDGTPLVNPLTTLGDMIYGGAAGATSRLAGNTTTTLQVLTQTGTGVVSAAPVWVSTNGTGNILRSAGTAAIASGKTLTVSNTLTLAGTDGTTLTFPSTSATIARTDAAQTFTGTQTFGAILASSLSGISSGSSLTLSVSGIAGIGLNTTVPNSQGTSFPVTTIGALASRGSGVFDSYSVLELAAAADGTDSDSVQSNEVDWVWPGYSISATKKKLAAIEVFLSGPTSGDRGGEWRLDTKADGGVLTSAVIVNRSQETKFRTIYAEGINASTGGAKITQSNLTFGVSANANQGSSINFQNSNSARNWQVIQNQTQAGALEFIPSTTLGGTTFTTPAWYFDSSGNFKDGGSHTLTVNGAVLSVASSVLNISTNASVGTAGSNALLTIGSAAPSGNNTGRLSFLTSNTAYNWRIATNDNIAGVLEFLPTTTAGGTTYSATNVLGLYGLGNVRAGVPGATTMTDGFLYVPSVAGTPTGVPTTITNFVPIVADRTNNKLYIYSGGAWVALN